MCVPTGSRRRQQRAVRHTIPDRDPERVSSSCSASEQESEAEPKLIELEVTGAQPLGGGRFWVLRDDRAKVRVKARTEPPMTPVTWTGGTATDSAVVQELSLAQVADVPIKATLDCDKTVTIEIYDLISVSCPLPLKNSRHKGYDSNKTTRLTAVTSPDLKKVWDLLTWTEGAAGTTNNERDVDLTPVGDRTVKVALGRKSLPVDLHICQWPRLDIKEVVFESHQVLNDGTAEIDVPFDKKWTPGRAAHAANRKTADSQSPICFTMEKTIKLSATFTVAPPSTDDEVVSVKADLGFAEIEADVPVAAGAGEATMATAESDDVLPKQVDYQAAWAITWTSVLEDDATWVAAGTSTSPLYVLLGDPTKDVYFTLLHLSCEKAAGKSTADDVVRKTFALFADAKGDGHGFVRKGDGKSMSYYNKGTDTDTSSDMQTTDGLLGNPDATGRCGGWATLLRHMWAMHGITATGRRWYIRADHPDAINSTQRFLVKNIGFKATGSEPDQTYTHDGTRSKDDVVKQEGLPGHGQNNPQFDFADHVVVKYGGKYYDPSYGVGPYDTDDAYLAAALDGLGRHPKIEFTFKGVPQHIPRHCVPYAGGAAEHTIITNAFDFYAKGFGKRGVDLFPLCTFNPVRTSVIQVQPGDEVVVRYMGKVVDETTLPPTKSLADIALKHSVTEDQIFNHPKNAALKTLRGTKTKLRNGDLIVVPLDLDPNAQRVVGHDI